MVVEITFYLPLQLKYTPLILINQLYIFNTSYKLCLYCYLRVIFLLSKSLNTKYVLDIILSYIVVLPL